MGYIFRNLTKADLPRIMALQFAYQKAYPKAVIIPGEVYLSPFLDYGKNMVCAFDELNEMQGYTGVNIYPAEQPANPHTLWSIIKVRPALVDKASLQEILFEKSLEVCQKLIAPYPRQPARLQFQHYSGEEDVISFLKNKGCRYLESVFHMLCDLSINTPAFPVPDGLTINHLEDTDAQKMAYLDAHNKSFPSRTYTLDNFQFFLAKQVGDNGRIFTAWDHDRIAGSITVFVDEEFNKHAGLEVGQIEDVFVSENYRQRGLAAYLIVRGLEYLKELRLHFAHLEVRAKNTGALKLYEKTGFVPGDETQFFYLDIVP